MYNIKTNSSRKETYKYNKPFNNKKRQNGSHYQHNKYNKYKSRYSNSDVFSQNLYEYDSNTFYKKDSKKIKKLKKKDLIEVNEPFQLNAEEQEIKENSSSHENSTYDYQTQEKTMEKSDKINYSCSYNNFDEEQEQEQDLNSSENNTIIFPTRNSLGRTNSQIFSDDKENLDSNIMTNGSYSNLNRANNINLKENINSIISSINLSSEDFKDAFYVPKKHHNPYNTSYSNDNINANSYQLNEGNKFNEIMTQNNFIQKTQQLNMLSNNNNYLLFNSQNTAKFESIQPFSSYDSYSSSSFHHKNSYDSFRSSMKSGSIIENEREKENTDILEIHVKISEKQSLVFKIRRYDDMFKTVKIFCEINKLDIKLIKPLIIYIIKALNSIYGIYNLKLKKEEIQYLQNLKNEYYQEDETKDEYLHDNDNESEDLEQND